MPAAESSVVTLVRLYILQIFSGHVNAERLCIAAYYDYVEGMNASRIVVLALPMTRLKFAFF